MSASVSVGWGPAIFGLVVFIVIIVLFLLFYGSIIAASGHAKNQGLGLLCGLLLILAGVCLLFYGYPDYANGKSIRQFGLLMTCIGSLVYAISKVLYIKKHNKALKKALRL